MATLTASGTPSLATALPCRAHDISGLLCGEALAAGDLVYIKSDGKLWKSNGTSNNAAAACVGITLVAAQVGEAASAYFDVVVRYAAGSLTPGAKLYVSATAGKIDDASTTGGTAPIGVVIDATRIAIWQSRY